MTSHVTFPSLQQSTDFIIVVTTVINRWNDDVHDYIYTDHCSTNYLLIVYMKQGSGNAEECFKAFFPNTTLHMTTKQERKIYFVIGHMYSNAFLVTV
jgi:hypothetical protein